MTIGVLLVATVAARACDLAGAGGAAVALPGDAGAAGALCGSGRRYGRSTTWDPCSTLGQHVQKAPGS